MNTSCEEFRTCWSEWQAGRLHEAAAARCAAERERCSACARYDRQMRALLGGLASLPLPDQPPQRTLPHRGPKHRRPWATAAGLAIAFLAGVLVASLPLDERGPADDVIRAEAVRILPQQTREIQVAVASPRRIEGVEFTIELPRGVELDGYPGQRVVRWDGELAAGRSRLTLPVRATSLSEAAEIVARIQHANGSRELRVPLEPVDTGARGPASIAAS